MGDLAEYWREKRAKDWKRRQVRMARQSRNHRCHWPGCQKQVPPAMWGCQRHWFSLPKEIRDAIWSAYVPGQETSGKVSAEYRKAALDAQAWIAAP